MNTAQDIPGQASNITMNVLAGSWAKWLCDVQREVTANRWKDLYDFIEQLFTSPSATHSNWLRNHQHMHQIELVLKISSLVSRTWDFLDCCIVARLAAAAQNCTGWACQHNCIASHCNSANWSPELPPNLSHLSSSSMSTNDIYLHLCGGHLTDWQMNTATHILNYHDISRTSC